MRDWYMESTPVKKNYGEWHLPYITADEHYSLDISEAVRISSARCARVSLLGHDGKRDLQKDLGLCTRLEKDRHMSPLEHPAKVPNTASPFLEFYPTEFANFQGWMSYRYQLEQES